MQLIEDIAKHLTHQFETRNRKSNEVVISPFDFYAAARFYQAKIEYRPGPGADESSEFFTIHTQSGSTKIVSGNVPNGHPEYQALD
jgi:hypothetical protein